MSPSTNLRRRQPKGTPNGLVTPASDQTGRPTQSPSRSRPSMAEFSDAPVASPPAPATMPPAPIAFVLPPIRHKAYMVVFVALVIVVCSLFAMKTEKTETHKESDYFIDLFANTEVTTADERWTRTSSALEAATQLQPALGTFVSSLDAKSVSLGSLALVPVSMLSYSAPLALQYIRRIARGGTAELPNF